MSHIISDLVNFDAIDTDPEASLACERWVHEESLDLVMIMIVSERYNINSLASFMRPFRNGFLVFISQGANILLKPVQRDGGPL